MQPETKRKIQAVIGGVLITVYLVGCVVIGIAFWQWAVSGG